MEKLECKLEEAYQHMKPYIDKKNAPELLNMCKYCELWVGDTHNYDVCQNMPCFKNWLGYAYLKWGKPVGNETQFYETRNKK